MQWPWRRVEAFYDAHLKRKMIQELTQRKIHMISALFSNSNYDSQENSQKRVEIIEKIEDDFNEAVRRLYQDPKEAEAEREAFKENPFFSAMNRGLKKQGVLEDELPPAKEEPEQKEEYKVDQDG